MNVHQLAIFWRDRQARCFTSWHFQPATGERADKRAAKLLALLPEFSSLQLYGAALDEEPLQIEQAQPAPSERAANRATKILPLLLQGAPDAVLTLYKSQQSYSGFDHTLPPF